MAQMAHAGGGSVEEDFVLLFLHSNVALFALFIFVEQEPDLASWKW
jgi:hypothetical protein